MKADRRTTTARSTVALVALLLVLSLSGCGPDDDTGGSLTDQGTVTRVDPASSGSDVVVVHVLYPDGRKAAYRVTGGRCGSGDFYPQCEG